jgi:hypothetical protein
VKDDRVYLGHIRDALDDVALYCRGDHDASPTACVKLRRCESCRSSAKRLRISPNTPNHFAGDSLENRLPAGIKRIHDYFGVGDGRFFQLSINGRFLVSIEVQLLENLTAHAVVRTAAA